VSEEHSESRTVEREGASKRTAVADQFRLENRAFHSPHRIHDRWAPDSRRLRWGSSAVSSSAACSGGFFGTFAFFLFVPFVPFLFRGSSGTDAPATERIAECPQCGFRTTDESYDFCPRDGTRLELQD